MEEKKEGEKRKGNIVEQTRKHYGWGKERGRERRRKEKREGILNEGKRKREKRTVRGPH